MIKNVVEKNKNIDVNEDKINKLKEMFPNCFNINGEFDISVFEEELKGASTGLYFISFCIGVFK